MNRLHLLVWLLVIGLACASNQKLTEPPPRRTYNREAMRHMINGTIEDLIGEPKNALVEYHQAAEIDSSSSGIYLALAENYYFLEEYNSSIRMARKALLRDAQNIQALELLAASYEKLRQFQNAARAYEQMIKLDPEDVEILYSLTSIQIIIKEFDKAVTTYRQLVRSGLEDPEYRLRIGHLFFQNRAFSQAGVVYQDVSKSNPDFEAAYLALAALSKAQKDTTGAIRIYQAALEKQAHFEEVKAELRILLERSKRFDEAILVFKKLVERDSTNLGDKLQVGQYHFLKGDTLAAVGCFKSVIAAHPQSERGYLALGAVQRAQRDSAGAMQTYEAAIAINPMFLDSRRRLRDLYAAQGRWDAAIALYDPLKENDSTYVGAHLEIANLLMQKGDTLQAISLCEELEKSNGDDWRVPVTLGRLLMVNDQPAAAHPRFDRALQLRNDLSLIWVLRGVNLIQLDSLEAAKQNFLSARPLFAQDPEVNYYLGIISTRLKQNSEAIAYLEKARELDANNLQTLLTLATLYDEAGEYGKSLALYQTLYQATPENPVILNNYAYHLAVTGQNLPQAREMVIEALALDPDNAAYWDTLGWVLFQMKDYEGARENILKSIELSADSAEVLEHLGDVYRQVGDPERAQKYYRQALDLDPSRRQVKVKLQQLDNGQGFTPEKP